MLRPKELVKLLQAFLRNLGPTVSGEGREAWTRLLA
jgi:hypothetical protein